MAEDMVSFFSVPHDTNPQSLARYFANQESSNSKIDPAACHGAVAEHADAGGATPTCLSSRHADRLCSHLTSDHNLWFLCSMLNWQNYQGSSYGSNGSGLLVDMPNGIVDAVRDCVNSDGEPRLIAYAQLQRLATELVNSNPMPFG
ncbi:unnamed protein product [Protopolystoma xenopodis]|uniref:Uncharacterized protein n=1 Tax=Protopolystoma xenopodis TaxID=117903 RepID=A0A448WTA6_9PLAT|nr:unnamed protein product [Protopolystoma xenopodis]